MPNGTHRPKRRCCNEVSEYTAAHHPKSPHAERAFAGQVPGNGFLHGAAARILEIGTFTGYSALCLAKGLEPGGVLHTIELRPGDAATAQQFFDQSAFKQHIILHIGDAQDIIGGLDETWDLVFIDADKISYTNYFNRVLPKLRKNGFILVDNVLFHGAVLSER
jgi:caffeoyl-CoA O-methyltransferase